MNLDEVIQKVSSVLKEAFTPSSEISITKSVDKEQRRALFVAMEPEVFDAHGDITSAEEVEKACNNFNRHCMVANLFHMVETDSAEIQQSWVSPVEMQIDDRIIKKGTWLQWWHFPDTEAGNAVWDMVKDGSITGISIGAKGKAVEIDE